MNKIKSAKNIEYVSLSSLFPVGRAPIGIFDFTNQIDTIYQGLGIPTLYGVLSILANKSVFFIGGRGIGKTRIINLIPDISETHVEYWDTFTLEELNSYCCKLVRCSGSVENKHLVFKVEEFSTLNDYHREIFLTVCSKIISDNNYTHNTKRMPYLEIKNCKLTLLIAVQPKLYSLLCNKYTQWESMSYDRFTKFLLLNPLRSETAYFDFVPTLPRKITDNVRFHRRELDLSKLTIMFRGHVSEGRAEIYAQDYVIALARFMGADEVRQEHVDIFHQLFHPYLESFSVLQAAEDLDSSVTVRSGHMNLLCEIGKHSEPVEKRNLARSLYVTERHIERGAKDLLEVGLIERPQQGKYCLSEGLRNFFKWYKNKVDFPL